MDIFKEIGITDEEILNTLSDAICFVDSHTEDGENTNGLGDRLFDVVNAYRYIRGIED